MSRLLLKLETFFWVSEHNQVFVFYPQHTSLSQYLVMIRESNGRLVARFLERYGIKAVLLEDIVKLRFLILLLFSIGMVFAQSNQSVVEDNIRLGYEQLNSDYGFAQIFFQEALKQEPNNLRALLGRGKSLLYQGAATLAAEDFKKVLELDPNNVEAMISLADAYKKQYENDSVAYSGRLNEALVLLQRASQLEPSNAKVLNLIGIVKLLSGDVNSAKSLLEQAVTYASADSSDLKASDVAGIHVNLGIIYRQTGDDKLALQSFRRAVMLNPLSAVARTNVGHTYFLLDDCDQAVYELSQANKINPQYLQATANLAIVKFECGDVEGSVKYFEDALKLPGAINLAGLYTYIARAYMQQGRYDEALNRAQQGVLLPPARAEAYYYLGQVYEKRNAAGAIENAKKAYRSSLEIDPNYQLALTALARLP